MLLSNLVLENKGVSKEELGIHGHFCPDFSFRSCMEITLVCTEIGAVRGYNLIITSSSLFQILKIII